MSAQPLPSERCPHCGLTLKPLVWAVDTVHDLERGYRCPNCGRCWSVQGHQESLFEKEAEPMPELPR